MHLHLTDLKTGQSAIVKDILGGSGAIHRIESLGIRIGKKITKVSGHFWRGPVTVKIDKAKVAIGWGMAHKIIVEAMDE